jgi:hypothetical protein
MAGLAGVLVLGGAQPGAAQDADLPRSDQAAAILTWPSVIAAEESFLGIGASLDTIIQVSNTSEEAVWMHCFYENANPHCTNTGEVCYEASECCDDPMLGCGLCAPGWNETDFRVQLTPRQPLGWLASEGMAGFSTFPPKAFGKFPLDGVSSFGIGGSSNAGSRIPPVAEDPFLGALRCIAVDADGVPAERNVLKGEATLVIQGEEFLTVGKHNAIGLKALDVNDDNVLVLGGPEAEYDGCSQVIILDHFFDGADDPVSPGTNPVGTILELVPCSEDYLRQIPGRAVVQYLVYNEFEQRFSTSRPMECKQFSLISNIDTTQNERSIFSAGVSGTLTGQSRINPIGSGLMAIAHELHTSSGLAQFNTVSFANRAEPDFIILP